MNPVKNRAESMDEVTGLRRSLWRRVGVLVALGLPGIATLWLQPIPPALLQSQPELAQMPEWAIKLLGLLNPILLLCVAAWCGAMVAHRVGLRSLLAGAGSTNDVTHGWGLSAAMGLVAGALLVALDMALAPWVGPAWEQFLKSASQPTLQSLAMGVLYGGITEELLMRWGLMSTLAWVLWVCTGKRHPGLALMVAAVLTAAAFGAAHLPALAVQVELNNAIVARTLVLNGLAALVYAWVFWRHHLEAAMLCHACSHLAMGAIWAWL